jgi:hypothetical protein
LIDGKGIGLELINLFIKNMKGGEFEYGKYFGGFRDTDIPRESPDHSRIL